MISLKKKRTPLDFARPGRACYLSVRTAVVWWAQTVSEPQHVEILRLLTRHRGGLTATELAEALFGDGGRAGQVRVLTSRLRKQVGGLLSVDRRQATVQARYRFVRNAILTIRDP